MVLGWFCKPELKQMLNAVRKYFNKKIPISFKPTGIFFN